MNNKQTNCKKMTEVPGAKRLANGYFVDLMFCPLCETHVDSLRAHLEEVHEE